MISLLHWSYRLHKTMKKARFQQRKRALFGARDWHHRVSRLAPHRPAAYKKGRFTPLYLRHLPVEICYNAPYPHPLEHPLFFFREAIIQITIWTRFDRLWQTRYRGIIVQALKHSKTRCAKNTSRRRSRLSLSLQTQILKKNCVIPKKTTSSNLLF